MILCLVQRKVKAVKELSQVPNLQMPQWQSNITPTFLSIKQQILYVWYKIIKYKITSSVRITLAALRDAKIEGK
jgi:hypothetical protein